MNIKRLYVYLGIFIVLALSRFVPHPPNFTSLLALSFYVPALLGISYLPVLLVSFVITDLIIGFHSTVLFTWGSVLIIGLISRYFTKSIIFRMSGALLGAFIFYLFTNFGVWVHRIQDLMDSRSYTPWSEYKNDKVIKGEVG